MAEHRISAAHARSAPSTRAARDRGHAAGSGGRCAGRRSPPAALARRAGRRARGRASSRRCAARARAARGSTLPGATWATPRAGRRPRSTRFVAERRRPGPARSPTPASPTTAVRATRTLEKTRQMTPGQLARHRSTPCKAALAPPASTGDRGHIVDRLLRRRRCAPSREAAVYGATKAAQRGVRRGAAARARAAPACRSPRSIRARSRPSCTTTRRTRMPDWYHGGSQAAPAAELAEAVLAGDRRTDEPEPSAFPRADGAAALARRRAACAPRRRSTALAPRAIAAAPLRPAPAQADVSPPPRAARAAGVDRAPPQLRCSATRFSRQPHERARGRREVRVAPGDERERVVAAAGRTDASPGVATRQPAASRITARGDRVAEPARGELQRGGRCTRPRSAARSSRRPRWARSRSWRRIGSSRAPARVVEDQRRGGEPLDRHRLAHALAGRR